MADKVKYLRIDDTQNYPCYRLYEVVEMFGQSTEWTNQSKFNKNPKVLEPTIKKRYYKTFGISLVNSPFSLPPCVFREFIKIRFILRQNSQKIFGVGSSSVLLHLQQGCQGISQRPIDWCISPLMIHKIITSVDYD